MRNKTLKGNKLRYDVALGGSCDKIEIVAM